MNNMTYIKNWASRIFTAHSNVEQDKLLQELVDKLELIDELQNIILELQQIALKK